jgi:hypothetical protein
MHRSPAQVFIFVANKPLKVTDSPLAKIYSENISPYARNQQEQSVYLVQPEYGRSCVPGKVRWKIGGVTGRRFDPRDISARYLKPPPRAKRNEPAGQINLVACAYRHHGSK